ncbi:MAG: STAS domain-containing protein [Acidobacteria bacterium]|nr:STAS domain-containing protein [Acidobacteriota bacterium]
MLRITLIAESRSSVTLKLEGRIVSDWVAVLKQESLTVLQERKRLVLDFSEVTFIDHRGVKMLKKLAHGKVKMINRSPLVLDLLK